MPLLLQNMHRYMLYFALGFIVILTWDAWEALWFATPDGGHELGIGVGTLVLGLNAFLLGGYTLGCHSLRHLIGGYADRISLRSKPQQKALDCVSCLNRSHMRWAWFSLAWVCFTDLYVRLCAMDYIVDVRLF